MTKRNLIKTDICKVEELIRMTRHGICSLTELQPTLQDFPGTRPLRECYTLSKFRMKYISILNIQSTLETATRIPASRFQINFRMNLSLSRMRSYQKENHGDTAPRFCPDILQLRIHRCHLLHHITGNRAKQTSLPARTTASILV